MEILRQSEEKSLCNSFADESDTVFYAKCVLIPFLPRSDKLFWHDIQPSLYDGVLKKIRGRRDKPADEINCLLIMVRSVSCVG